MNEAQQYTSLAAEVIARREPHYRFDVNDLTGAYPNATIYPTATSIRRTRSATGRARSFRPRR